jgi:predicted dehydrogenase
VVIATRHDSHAAMTIEALQAGKFVFVEKPLAINHSQIEALRSVVAGLPGARLMVGFNRRYAPLVAALKTAIDGRSGAKAFIYTVNAGAIPPQHWTQRSEGGGRIIGEACHFVDLLRFLTGARIVGANARYAADHDGRCVADVATLSLSFADGSIGTIHYLANGSARFPKERIEVFAGGGVLVLDNFRRLRSIGWAGASSRRMWRQDKGQRHCAAQVVAALRSGGAAPIPVEELFEVAEWCCRLAESSTGEPRAANDLAMPV